MGFQFNQNEMKSGFEAAQADFSPVPEGWYTAQIIKDEAKVTAAGGTRLLLTFRIYGDKCQGRQVFGSYNVVCPGHDEAQSIAYKQIGKLALSCGCPNAGDSSELINKACKIKVVIKPDKDGTPRNEISAYDKIDGPAPAPFAPAQPTASAQPDWWTKK